MRLSIAFFFLLPLLSRAQGPYSVLLASGDTLTSKEYYTRGDTVGLTGVAKFAAKDVVLLWTPRERWTFTYPGGDRKKIRTGSSDPCLLGHITAERCEALACSFDSLPVPGGWKQDTLVLACYRARLEERLIFTDEFGDRVKEQVPEGTGGVAIGQPSQIILRTGDTLFLKKEFHVKDTMLCVYGGQCIPMDDILLFRTVKDQFFFKSSCGCKLPLERPLPDMSMASKGRLYAHFLFASGNEWADADIPNDLKGDTSFQQAYRNEVVRMVYDAERLRKRANTMQVASGALSGFSSAGTLSATGAGARKALGASIGAAVGDARALPPHEEPYYGTPMPPE